MGSMGLLGREFVLGFDRRRFGVFCRWWSGGFCEGFEMKKEKKYEKFMNEQFEILKKHFERCMLRCHNKLMELENNSTGNQGV